VLLSTAELDNRQTYLNARNTLGALLSMGNVIPVVNENDSVATEQITFGDNDTLSARVAAKMNADLLIILSDVDGLYDRNPAQHDEACLIETVDAITPEIEALAGGASAATSTGGMRTKLAAARITSAAGVAMVIANGRREGVLRRVLEGEQPFTLFRPAAGTLSHRKRWLAFGRVTPGRLMIDAGAAKALRSKGRSLLAAGVTAVEGRFDMGDAVHIVGPGGEVIARGLVNYPSADIERIKGCKSTQIQAILGRKDFDEIIHRDNLVLLSNGPGE
jgi:glutamate 5-kinase